MAVTTSEERISTKCCEVENKNERGRRRKGRSRERRRRSSAKEEENDIADSIKAVEKDDVISYDITTDPFALAVRKVNKEEQKRREERSKSPGRFRDQSPGRYRGRSPGRLRGQSPGRFRERKQGSKSPGKYSSRGSSPGKYSSRSSRGSSPGKYSTGSSRGTSPGKLSSRNRSPGKYSERSRGEKAESTAPPSTIKQESKSFRNSVSNERNQQNECKENDDKRRAASPGKHASRTNRRNASLMRAQSDSLEAGNLTRKTSDSENDTSESPQEKSSKAEDIGRLSGHGKYSSRSCDSRRKPESSCSPSEPEVSRRRSRERLVSAQLSKKSDDKQSSRHQSRSRSRSASPGKLLARNSSSSKLIEGSGGKNYSKLNKESTSNLQNRRRNSKERLLSTSEHKKSSKELLSQSDHGRPKLRRNRSNEGMVAPSFRAKKGSAGSQRPKPRRAQSVNSEFFEKSQSKGCILWYEKRSTTANFDDDDDDPFSDDITIGTTSGFDTNAQSKTNCLDASFSNPKQTIRLVKDKICDSETEPAFPNEVFSFGQEDQNQCRKDDKPSPPKWYETKASSLSRVRARSGENLQGLSKTTTRTRSGEGLRTMQKTTMRARSGDSLRNMQKATMSSSRPNTTWGKAASFTNRQPRNTQNSVRQQAATTVNFSGKGNNDFPYF